MIHPIDKVHITQNFGENPHIYKRFGMAGHNGVDYRVRFIDSPKGRRYIVAALDGEVMEVADVDRGGYGRFVRLMHENGAQTIYAHHTRNYVKKGDKVKMGDRIGLSGNTGFSTGPHLHFGFRPPGWEDNYNNGFKGYIDPLPYINGDKKLSKLTFDPEFTKKWAGWLIIVPELGGETWYVSPKTLKRYKLSGGVKSADASILARDGVWVGMSYNDLIKIKEA